MKLYYSKGACSLSVRILMHELGIPCEYEAVDLKAKKTEKNADFYSIYPKGEVPTLVLDNKDILTENVAIHQFLADLKKTTDIFPTDESRYHVIEWLNFVASGLHKSFSPLFNSEIPDELKETVFKKILKDKLKMIDNHLANHQYVVGDHYTLPDGYMFTVLRWVPHFKIELSEWPNIVRYYNLMKERKSVQQALQEEGLKA